MARKIINDSRQIPLLVPDMTWLAPDNVPFDENNPPSVLALDTETNDPNLNTMGPSWFRGGGYLVGISLAWAGGDTYLPIRHGGGDNMNPDTVLGWLRHMLKNFKGTLVLANGFYDLGWLRMENIHVNPEATLWDVQMVEALLDENRQRYNLNALAMAYSLKPKDETALQHAAEIFGLDAKSGLHALRGNYVGPYACRDASLTLEVYNRQQPLVQLQKLERVVKLEHDLVPLLMEMRWRGVRVDTVKAEKHMNEFMAECEGYREQIRSLTGYLPDIWTADSCAVAMDKMDIRYNRTAKGAPSFTDDWLTTFPEGTVPFFISKARKSYKAGQTFCKNMILDHADAAGRIHAEFHPLRSDDGGTVSGRFSCSNPNLQQVSGRDPRMFLMIRGLFLPEEGEQYCAADYSQQEPRLTIHYAEERGCSKAAEAAERYRSDPDTDYHNMVAEMVFGSGFSSAQRKKAKTINLGLAYGMGGAKLARSLGLPTKMITLRGSGREMEVAGDEAKALLDQYHNQVPFIRELQVHYGEIVGREGAIRTLSGRTCRFPYYEPLNGGRALMQKEAVSTYGAENIKRAYTHTALNRKIQGGSADMIKIAMRNLWREGLVPLITIHDEIDISVPDIETAKRVAEIMATCVPLRVPLKVDLDLGATWGEAKPFVEEED